MKKKKFWLFFLTLVMIASVAVSTFTMAFASIPEKKDVVTDYIANADSLLNLEQGAAKNSDGSAIEMKPSGNARISTKDYVKGLSSFEFTMSFESPKLSDWIAFVMFMDTAPGKATWERSSATETAYSVSINPTVISIQRGIGNSFSAAGDNCEYAITDSSAFYAAEHTFKVEVSTALSGTSIALTLDGTKVIETVDTSAQKLSNDGAITFVTHNDTGLSVTVSALKSTAAQTAFDYKLTEDDLSLTQGATWNENVINMPSDAISRVNTQEAITDMVSFEIAMNINTNASQWIAQLFFMDSAPGKTSWERSEGNPKAYMIDFSPTVIAIKRYVGTNAANLTNCEYSITSDFYATAHTYKVSIQKSLAKVDITLSVDGTTVITATDDSAQKITDDGYITLANHNGAAAEIDVTYITVGIEREQKEDTKLFDEATLQNGISDLSATNATIDTENSTATLKNDGLAAVYTKSQYRNLKLCLGMKLDVSNVPSDYSDWYAMLAISDQSPNSPVWVSESAKERYIFYFSADAISLRYYNGATHTDLASYTLPSGFYDTEHVYNITLVAQSSGVQIMMNIDEDAIEFNVTDTAESKILKAGAIYLLTQGDKQIGASVSKFKTSAPEEVSEELTTDFDFDSVQTQIDFTDLVDRSNWTGSMNENEFAGHTIFYKGGTKDNIFLNSPSIKTVGTWPNGDINYTDFVLNFKATVTWPEDAGDWGAMITFRDSEPGIPPWEQNTGNTRVAYALRWDVDAQNSDTTTNGKISIVRYNGAGGGVGLCELKNQNINGKEITYKLACVNGNDDIGDYVRIVVLADGVCVADVKDYGENNTPKDGVADYTKPNITTGGGFMLINHYVRTFHIKGIKAGEAVDELVIGASQGEDSGDSGNQGGNSGDSGNQGGGNYSGDDAGDIENNKKKGCGSSLVASSAFISVVSVLGASVVTLRKKRR